MSGAAEQGGWENIIDEIVEAPASQAQESGKSTLEQRRERRALLLQVVEQGTHVGSRRRKNGKGLTGTDLCDDDQALLIFQNPGPERPCYRAGAEAPRVLHDARGERGKGICVQRLTRDLLNGESVGAEHNYCLDPFTAGQLGDDFCQSTHGHLG